MSPENEHAHLQTIAIATTAAQAAATIALLLKQQVRLPEPHAGHLARLIRHLGELFQDASDDTLAGDFGAIAAALAKP